MPNKTFRKVEVDLPNPFFDKTGTSTESDSDRLLKALGGLTAPDTVQTDESNLTAPPVLEETKVVVKQPEAEGENPFLSTLKTILVGRKDTPGMGGLVGLAKDMAGQTAYGSLLIDPILRNTTGISLYGNSASSVGDSGDEHYLNAIMREANRINAKPFNQRTSTEAKFLETVPENVKVWREAQKATTDATDSASKRQQLEAGSFGKLREGRLFDGLNDLANKRVKLGALIVKQRKHLNELAKEAGKGKNADPNRIRQNLLELQSAGGQASAIISEASGQGAMSEADKLNLDRANAEIKEVTQGALGAAGISVGSIYPIFVKLRAALPIGINAQSNFLESTITPFRRAEEMYGTVPPSTFDRFSGQSAIKDFAAENLGITKDGKIDFNYLDVTDPRFAKAEEVAIADDLKQAAEAAERTSIVAPQYPSPAGIAGKKALDAAGGGSKPTPNKKNKTGRL